MKCCQMRRSARPTTSSDMRASTRRWGWPRIRQWRRRFQRYLRRRFRRYFGRWSQRSVRRYSVAPDLRYNLELGLEDTVAGTSVKISAHGSAAIPAVAMAPRRAPRRRPAAPAGAGQVRMQQGSFGSADMPDLPRQGQRDRALSGVPWRGAHPGDQTLSVKVPPGVDSGDRIRLAGEGRGRDNGGPPGDLYVQVHVREHRSSAVTTVTCIARCRLTFRLRHWAVSSRSRRSDGKVKLEDRGTQTGKMFRMRGKVSEAGTWGPQGDLICRVVVETRSS